MNPFRRSAPKLSAAGSLVVDEQMVPITEVRLEAGKIWFVACLESCAAPVTMESGQEFRIHGSDGTEIASCRWTVNGGKPVTAAVGERLTLVFPIRIDAMVGGGEQQR